MAYRLEFRDFRQRRGVTTAQRLGNIGQGVIGRGRRHNRPATGAGLVEDQHGRHQGLEGIVEGSERINLSEISLRIRAIIRAYMKTNKSIVRN